MANEVLSAEPVSPTPALLVTAPAGARRWPRSLTWREVITPVALYLFAVALLTIRLGSHPAWTYNWESYTARDVLAFRDHPTWGIFQLYDGVMTDSGHSPLIALPVWASFALFGVSLAAMRLPIVLLAALAPPLTWLVGRRLAGAGVAMLGAALLALSPVFLLYGRTATLVGLSLVPALLTIYALLRVLQRPRGWPWLIALQVFLLSDAFAYSPIRFLWPLSVILLLGELLWRKGQRRWFLVALIVTALVLPLGITGAYRSLGYRGWDKSDPAILSYYDAHGEQLAALRSDPSGMESYIRGGSPADPTGTATHIALRLVRQNTVDLGRLLTDQKTRPAITDYWNPSGRLYPWFLVPFFVIGSLVTLWRVFSRVEARAWLALFWGFSLPLLLTSRVHIGRLIFIMPLLMLFVALGLVWSGQMVWTGVTAAIRRVLRERASSHGRWSVLAPRLLVVVGLVAVLGIVARSTWTDYRVAPTTGAESRIAGVLRANKGAIPLGAGVALVLASGRSGLEGESLTVSGLRVMLDSQFRFGAPVTGDPAPGSDTRPPVYAGGLLLGPLAAPETLPTFCQNLYVVPKSNLDRFHALTDTPARADCPAPLWVVTPPD